VRDDRVSVLMDKHADRRRAFFEIYDQIGNAVIATHHDMCALSLYADSLMERNDNANELVLLAQNKADGAGRRVKFAKQKMKSVVEHVKQSKISLQKQFRETLAMWRAVTRFLETEIDEWKKIGKKTEELVRRYERCATILKASAVALAVVGAAVIGLCIAGSVALSSAVMGALCTVAAELLGLGFTPTLSVCYTHANQQAENCRSLIRALREGLTATTIVGGTYEGMQSLSAKRASQALTMTRFADNAVRCPDRHKQPEEEVGVLEKGWRARLEGDEAYPQLLENTTEEARSAMTASLMESNKELMQIDKFVQEMAISLEQ